jgi:hypothetical protein
MSYKEDLDFVLRDLIEDTLDLERYKELIKRYIKKIIFYINLINFQTKKPINSILNQYFEEYLKNKNENEKEKYTKDINLLKEAIKQKIKEYKFDTKTELKNLQIELEDYNFTIKKQEALIEKRKKVEEDYIPFMVYRYMNYESIEAIEYLKNEKKFNPNITKDIVYKEIKLGKHKEIISIIKERDKYTINSETIKEYNEDFKNEDFKKEHIKNKDVESESESNIEEEEKEEEEKNGIKEKEEEKRRQAINEEKEELEKEKETKTIILDLQPIEPEPEKEIKNKIEKVEVKELITPLDSLEYNNKENQKKDLENHCKKYKQTEEFKTFKTIVNKINTKKELENNKEKILWQMVLFLEEIQNNSEFETDYQNAIKILLEEKQNILIENKTKNTNIAETIIKFRQNFIKNEVKPIALGISTLGLGTTSAAISNNINIIDTSKNNIIFRGILIGTILITAYFIQEFYKNKKENEFINNNKYFKNLNQIRIK